MLEITSHMFSQLESQGVTVNDLNTFILIATATEKSYLSKCLNLKQYKKAANLILKTVNY